MDVLSSKYKSEMPYEERLEFMGMQMKIGGTLMKGWELIKLVSLTCAMTQAYQKTKPETKPYHVLVKAYGKPANEVEKEMLVRVSLNCELFLGMEGSFDTYGLKDPKQILDEIKELVGQWCPF